MLQAKFRDYFAGKYRHNDAQAVQEATDQADKEAKRIRQQRRAARSKAAAAAAAAAAEEQDNAINPDLARARMAMARAAASGAFGTAKGPAPDVVDLAARLRANAEEIARREAEEDSLEVSSSDGGGGGSDGDDSNPETHADRVRRVYDNAGGDANDDV